MFWSTYWFSSKGDDLSSAIVEHLTQATSTTCNGSSSHTEFLVSETVLNEDKTMSIATIRPSPEKSEEGPRKFIHRHIDSVARIIVEESVDAARMDKQPVEDKPPAEEGKRMNFIKMSNSALYIWFLFVSLLTNWRTHLLSCDLAMVTSPPQRNDFCFYLPCRSLLPVPIFELMVLRIHCEMKCLSLKGTTRLSRAKVTLTRDPQKTDRQTQPPSRPSAPSANLVFSRFSTHAHHF